MDWLLEEIEVEKLAAEVALTPLRDIRNRDRVEDIIAALGQNPEAGFAELLEPAQQKALSRLLRNRDADHRTLAEPHLHATARRVERCVELGMDIAFIADTNDLRFKHIKKRMVGMGVLNGPTDQGMRFHSIIAVTARAPHLPLGTLDYALLTRKPGPVPEGRPEVAWDKLDNEGDRWRLVMERALSRIECRDQHRHIHLADREGDDYALMGWLCEQHERFIIRSCREREVLDEASEAGHCALQQALARLEPVLGRLIRVSTRDNKAAPPKARKEHPSREARTAKVEVRAGQFVVLRPVSHPKQGKQTVLSLRLSVVEVYEVDVPNGQQPVHWLLVSTEPVETPEQVEWIVDTYSVRWVYEEFTKAHRTGCAMNKHRFRSAWVWCAYWMLTMVFAWRLLALRCARYFPDADPRAVVRPSQLAVLERHGRTQPLLERYGRTLRGVLYAIAALGGHVLHNGPPGWQVLARGYAKLLQLEAGFLLAVEQTEGVAFATDAADATVRAPPPA